MLSSNQSAYFFEAVKKLFFYPNLMRVETQALQYSHIHLNDRLDDSV